MSEIVKSASKINEKENKNSSYQKRKTEISQSMSSPIDQILFLQRNIGNQAVEGLLKYGAIQAKLKISQPNDKYEQEADRISELVMGKSNHINLQRDSSARGTLVKTQKATHCADQSTAIPEGDKAVIGSGRGQPLDESTREFMEPRFGYDFSNVRILDDPQANDLAESLSARAFTVGNNIFFNSNESYDSKLFAHELIHTIQNNNGQILREEKSTNFTSTTSKASIDNPQSGESSFKKPPWNKNELQNSLETMYTMLITLKKMEIYDEGKFKEELEDINGEFILGMQLLQLWDKGYRDPPYGSIPFGVFTNFQRFEPRELLSWAYFALRFQMFVKSLQKESEKKESGDFYENFFNNPPDPTVVQFIQDMQKQILGIEPEQEKEPEKVSETESKNYFTMKFPDLMLPPMHTAHVNLEVRNVLQDFGIYRRIDVFESTKTVKKGTGHYGIAIVKNNLQAKIKGELKGAKNEVTIYVRFLEHGDVSIIFEGVDQFGNSKSGRKYVKCYPTKISKKLFPSSLTHFPKKEKTTSYFNLKVSHPNDPYELEADRIAEQVMRMPEPNVNKQPEEEKKELLQTKNDLPQTSEVTSGLERHIYPLTGKGQLLSASERAFFEPRIGYDFSSVKVHTDSKAAEVAKTVNAQAFTLGNDIFLGPNESASDKKLIAHELVHVIQQSNAVSPYRENKLQMQKEPIKFVNKTVKNKVNESTQIFRVKKDETQTCEPSTIFVEIDIPLPFSLKVDNQYFMEEKKLKEDEWEEKLESSSKGQCKAEGEVEGIKIEWDLGNPKIGSIWGINLNKNNMEIDAEIYVVHPRAKKGAACGMCVAGKGIWNFKVEGERKFGKRIEEGSDVISGTKESEGCDGRKICALNKTINVVIAIPEKPKEREKAEITFKISGPLRLEGAIYSE